MIPIQIMNLWSNLPTLESHQSEFHNSTNSSATIPTLCLSTQPSVQISQVRSTHNHVPTPLNGHPVISPIPLPHPILSQFLHTPPFHSQSLRLLPILPTPQLPHMAPTPPYAFPQPNPFNPPLSHFVPTSPSTLDLPRNFHECL